MFHPGWADEFGKGLSEKLTESEREEATGLKPRSYFRRWNAVSKESARRGSAKTKRRYRGVKKGGPGGS